MSSATGAEFPVWHLTEDARIYVKNGKLQPIHNYAELEGKILSCEKIELVEDELILRVTSQVSNKDTIDYPAMTGGLSVKMSVYDPENIKAEDNDKGGKNIEVKVGETVTFEQDLDIMFWDVINCLDRAMVKVELYYEDGLLDMIEYPLTDFQNGITNVNTDQEVGDAPAYNLFGQPTQGQGFVVKNGRVVFVK